MDDLAGLAQFMPVRINFKMSEAIFHHEPPQRMISTEINAFQRRTNAFLNNSAKLYPKPKSTDQPSILQWTTPPMGRLLSVTATRVPVQGAELRAHRPGRKPKHLVWSRLAGSCAAGAAPGLRLTYHLTELYQCSRPIFSARSRS